MAIGAAAVSCAALIGIGERLADDPGEGGPGGDAEPDALVDVASPDAGLLPTYGVGDGHRGPFSLDAGGGAMNSFAPLTAGAAGVDKLSFDVVRGPEPFKVGDLVLVIQITTTSLPPGADTTPFDLATTNIGHWEMARVTAIAAGPDAGGDAGSGGELTLDHRIGVATPFTAPGAQVVMVPEYTDVTIPTGASIYAPSWDGVTGGILAFYASGAVKNDGTLSADGVGFRGGIGYLSANAALENCAAKDGLPDAGYARKGEGFVQNLYGDAGGFGTAGNGGGGGNCRNAGGGGGGNGGVGGQGGFSADGDDDVGGRGGIALRSPSLLSRLTFGGGGGAGEADDGRDVPGAPGGGILFIRAREVSGVGRLSARGYSGTSGVRGDYSGAGGGGAGGSALVQAVGSLVCAQQLTVRGGSGSWLESFNTTCGPGGGGGGGKVLIQGKPTACSIENRAGGAGAVYNAVPTNLRGATPDAGLELTEPYLLPPEILTEPYCGTCP
jgi:hypothetical protein